MSVSHRGPSVPHRAASAGRITGPRDTGAPQGCKANSSCRVFGDPFAADMGRGLVQRFDARRAFLDGLALGRLDLRAVAAAAFVFAPRFAHNRCEARRAPLACASSFAHTMLSCTSSEPAKVAKPQSEPAMTFSRPTMSA